MSRFRISRQRLVAIADFRDNCPSPDLRRNLCPLSFIQLVLAEFKALHAGNAVRFGIRPLEWAAWQERQITR